MYGTIEIVVTTRSSLAKEKNAILFWNNWVANQLAFSSLLMNVYLFIYLLLFFYVGTCSRCILSLFVIHIHIPGLVLLYMGIVYQTRAVNFSTNF